MARKHQEGSVRFFTADGAEVESIWDLAGPRKDELMRKFVRALAQSAAKRDYLEAINGQSRKRRKRVLTPPGGHSNNN
jgi:hypothetical protein